MPPKRTRAQENTAAVVDAEREDYPKERARKQKRTAKASSSNDAAEVSNNGLATLASLPPELFDEIFSYFNPLSTDYHRQSSDGRPPKLEYGVYMFTLRAVSQTCRALRAMALPRLWSMIEAVWVPKSYEGQYYHYVMASLRHKSNVVAKADDYLRSCVRTLVIMITRSELDLTLSALKMLRSLHSLHTVQIINCKVPAQLKRALKNVSLPSVRMLVLVDGVAPLLQACTNVKHVRVCDHKGLEVVSNLKYCDIEVFDGHVDWSAKNQEAIAQLVANAPNLHTLGISITYTTYYFSAYLELVWNAAELKSLRHITITFDFQEHLVQEDSIIQAARQVMRDLPVSGNKTLEVRRALDSHVSGCYNDPDGMSDQFRIQRETFRG